MVSSAEAGTAVLPSLKTTVAPLLQLTPASTQPADT